MGRSYTKQRRANIKEEVKADKKIKKTNKLLSKSLVNIQLLREALIDFYDHRSKESNYLYITQEEVFKSARILNKLAELNLSDSLVEKVADKLFKDFELIDIKEKEDISLPKEEEE